VTVSLGKAFTVTPGQTYWLTLTHAADQFDGYEGWDVNFGPSEAWLESKWDPIPSESFAINPMTVPEPGGIALFASAMLGMLTGRRKEATALRGTRHGCPHLRGFRVYDRKKTNE
jgi:hypothetical protein